MVQKRHCLQFEYFADADAAEETHHQQREQQEQHHVSQKPGPCRILISKCVLQIYSARELTLSSAGSYPLYPLFRREGQSAKITNLTFRAESSLDSRLIWKTCCQHEGELIFIISGGQSFRVGRDTTGRNSDSMIC